MFVNRTQGVVATAVGVLLLGACSDPELRTDLRPDGPPEVLAVLVMNDAQENLLESATYCKVNDDKRPGLVGLPDFSSHQICPDDLSKGADEVTDAYPPGWYVRIMFDELLDPSVEDLEPIVDASGMPTGTYNGTLKNTQPVTLQCESVTGGGLVDVPYDGYYSPSGNNVIWPLGPSLVIKPADPTLIGTGKECQVSIKATSVHDKDGNPVPTEQLGPYKFKIAPVQVVAIAPADGDAVNGQDAGIDLTFNTDIDFTKTWTDLGGANCSASNSCFGLYDPTPTFDITPAVMNQYIAPEANNELFIAGDFPTMGDFTFAFKDNAKIYDHCGVATTFMGASVDTNTKVEFTTNPLKLQGTLPFDGQMNATASAKVKIDFNQYMDFTTLKATDVDVTPAITGLAVTYDPADPSHIVVTGNFATDTDYTFTLKTSAMIKDCPGAENHPVFGLGNACVPSATFTPAMPVVVHFHTVSLAMSGTTPKDMGTITLGSSATPSRVLLSFTNTVDPTTLKGPNNGASTTAWSISPAITGLALASTTPTSSLAFTSGADFPPGDYTFTFKAGSTITDVAGKTYTQAADKVIHFTVAPAAPTPPAPACL